MVFFAGMPGTGKSLFVHQLVHLAAHEGRRVHLLQWDVARPVVEASERGRVYPQVDNITHPVLRRATELWARAALVGWQLQAGANDMLIGETPLIGGRFSELARKQDDPAEPLLASDACRFALVVPTDEVRRHVISERERRFASPLHEREREDAPPHAMLAMWRELLDAGSRLGLSIPDRARAGEYDAAVYRHVYERLLRHRLLDIIEVDTLLPTGGMSVYDIRAPAMPVAPSEEEAAALIARAEAEMASLRPWWDV
jgi:hypothetical protein